MKYSTLPLVVLLSVCVSAVFAIVSASAQGQSTALERGYRTGYSDGYTAGYKDISVNAPRDYQSKEDYRRADRSFNEAWGTIDDYRDGYQQGFEAGYSAGYERQQFNSNLPVGFKRRGAAGPTANGPTAANDTTGASVNDQNTTANNQTNDQNVPVTNGSNGSLAIPRNTILALELLTPVPPDASQRGARIQPRVVEPSEFAGYIID